MSDVPAVRVNAHPITSWANKVNNALAGNSIANSPDFLVRHDAGGTSIRLHPKHKQLLGLFQYTGSYWDVSASFDPNTMVRVTGSLNGSVAGTYVSNRPIPSLYFLSAMASFGLSATGSDFAIYARDASVNYIPGNTTNTASNAWDVLQSGNGSDWQAWDENKAYAKGVIVWVDPNKTYSISFFDTSSGGGPPLNAGAFFVENDVADSGSRPSGNYYFPFYPTWDDSATVTVSGSVKNQIFFRPINPLSIVSACINNKTVQGFGMFYQSGSDGYAFALPYTG